MFMLYGKVLTLTDFRFGAWLQLCSETYMPTKQHYTNRANQITFYGALQRAVYRTNQLLAICIRQISTHIRCWTTSTFCLHNGLTTDPRLSCDCRPDILFHACPEYSLLLKLYIDWCFCHRGSFRRLRYIKGQLTFPRNADIYFA